MSEFWLLADVGASNTRIGLARAGVVQQGSVRIARNAEHDGFTALVLAYLSDIGAGPPEAICAGVAGPVRGDAAQLTNRDWHIDARALGAATGAARVRLINDLQAQAHALDDLPPGALRRLIPGRPDPAGARLALGLGTGCNIAVAHRVKGRLFVPPSEAGHTRLPLLDLPAGLVAALGWHGAHLPVEAALCGEGLLRIARWCGSDAGRSAEVIGCADGGPEAAALRHYLRILGTVAGDMALAHLPRGGIYLIGGLARALAPFIATPDFARAFTDKGPYRAILEDIPLSLITDDAAALYGCARVLSNG
ncbi:glucokinase [Roseovarius spongiae]|uniref:Glucokinase n=1 Tax=Roseovarius spongiae TaxID=2320272 RepID=A0A3A8ATM7_9RHOB|nr:glucokinase [Roseovarius spongiae]RKF14000.1 glucokinase [Roseovarius spongiae]